MKEYKQSKTVEQKVEDFLVPKIESASRFIDSFGRGFYSSVASLFGMPTCIRRVSDKGEIPTNFGNRIGITAGCAVDTILIVYTAYQAEIGNYTPLTILGATNLTSGAFEIGRAVGRGRNLESKTRGK